MQRIQIFRTGRHTDMSGTVLQFGEADLAAMAAAYDPALHEAPIVIGHPKADAPAYGWIGALKVQGGALEATPKQVDPAFAEIVTAGRYKKVSASFYTPTAPSNPKPGQYYLRHVGFLGAQPPALKGLKPIEFADAEEGIVEFAEDAETMGAIARLFRGVRELFIGQYGADATERALPQWELDELQRRAVEASIATQPAPAAAPAYSEAAKPQPSAELVERERALQARELEFAERQAELRRREDTDFLAELVRQGRLLPAQQAQALAFMQHLDTQEAVDFGEVKATPAAAFRGLLQGYPQLIELGEVAPDHVAPPTANLNSPADIVAKSVEYQEAMRKLGREVSNIEAVRAVTGDRA